MTPADKFSMSNLCGRHSRCSLARCYVSFYSFRNITIQLPLRHKASCQLYLHGSEQTIVPLPSTFQTPRKILQSLQHSNSLVGEFYCCGFLPLATSRVPPSVSLLFSTSQALNLTPGLSVDEYRPAIYPGIDLSNDKRCIGTVRRRP